MRCRDAAAIIGIARAMRRHNQDTGKERSWT